MSCVFISCQFSISIWDSKSGKEYRCQLKAVVLLFCVLFFNRRRLVLKSTILLRISKGFVVFVISPSSCYDIRM